MNRPNFEELVSDHYQPLYRFAFALTSNESGVCDLTQQTFCIWAEKGHQLRDTKKARSWLYTTLNREFLMRERRYSRFPECEFDEEFIDAADLSPTVVSELDSRLVVDALNELEPVYRTPLALFYLENYSYQMISDILEVPMGTIKSRISRGKKRLGRSLERQHLILVVEHG